MLSYLNKNFPCLSINQFASQKLSFISFSEQWAEKMRFLLFGIMLCKAPNFRVQAQQCLINLYTWVNLFIWELTVNIHGKDVPKLEYRKLYALPMLLIISSHSLVAMLIKDWLRNILKNSFILLW